MTSRSPHTRPGLRPPPHPACGSWGSPLPAQSVTFISADLMCGNDVLLPFPSAHRFIGLFFRARPFRALSRIFPRVFKRKDDFSQLSRRDSSSPGYGGGGSHHSRDASREGFFLGGTEAFWNQMEEAAAGFVTLLNATESFTFNCSATCFVLGECHLSKLFFFRTDALC